MNSPLWIDKHRPTKVSNFPQESVQKQLEIAEDSDMNYLISGYEGVGKTAATEVLVDESKVSFLNISDLFSMSKEDLTEKQMLQNVTKSAYSKRELVQKLVEKHVQSKTIDDDKNTIVFENSGNMREDFQHALRRMMEKYAETTRFVITTRNLTSVIRPIRSRCYNIYIRPPNMNEIVTIMNEIQDHERTNIPNKVIKYAWNNTRPNMRQFLLLLQTLSVQYDEYTIDNTRKILEEISLKEDVITVLNNIKNNNYKKAKQLLQELIYDNNNSPEMVRIKLHEHSNEVFDKEEYINICDNMSKYDTNFQNTIDPIPVLIQVFTERDS